jgi:transcriptional regulator with XRE-family HTH domain
MAKTLGAELKAAREARGLSLRAVERATGVHNAHLSQIETDVITRPDIAMLWELASFYELDYGRLMRLAGHAKPGAPSARESQRLSLAFRTMGELSPQDQNKALAFMADLKRTRERDS